jgi:uncharacterized protein YyaL (SSP411 family)
VSRNPRLADVESPYLAEAASQPVDWHPWSEGAFEKAREEDKPVIVDSGAIWCHWCHVMDHESYEDPQTAELINEHFVPIKLDRDERPDVDRRLQNAVGAITGRGGWPLTAFLTPEGDVYYGGTYFPREPKRGMPSFRQVLTQAAELYNDEQEKAIEQASRIREALAGGDEPAPGQATRDKLEAAIEDALTKYDPAQGGFGDQPKFPHATTMALLLDRVLATGNDERLFDPVAHTLEAMGEGGIFDHLAGGFHRYSTDGAWHVPHFEKMLYDNGLLAGLYAQASATADCVGDGRAGQFASLARETGRFLREVLEQRPHGGFGGSQDADRPPDEEGPLSPEDLEEGNYFTWTLDEVENVLDGDELEIANLYFGVQADGDVRHTPDRNVLHVVSDASAIAEGTDRSEEEVQTLIDSVRERLAQARAKRKAPPVDPTVYAGWNGLAIEGLAQAGAIIDDESALEAAQRAADRLIEEAFDPDRGFAHALSETGPRVWGLAGDQVNMLAGLVDLYNVTQDQRYLDVADQTGRVLVDQFVTDEGQLLFNADEDKPAPQGDQPTPAPAAQAALHLPRLARLTGEDGYRAEAETLLEAQLGRSEKLGGIHGATLHRALAAHLDESPHVVVTGEGPDARELLDAAAALPVGTKTVLAAPAPDEPGVPEEARATAGSFDEPRAIVCRDRACQVAQTPNKLREIVLR